VNSFNCKASTAKTAHFKGFESIKLISYNLTISSFWVSGAKMIRAVRTILISAIALTALSAEAANQYRFRYMDTIWDGNGNVINPGDDGKNNGETFSCPNPSGVYAANYTQQVDSVSCYYDQPTVSTSTAVAPLKLNAVSAANWCKSVLSNSAAISAQEMITKSVAAGFDGTAWAAQSNSTWTDGVICSRSGKPITDPPVMRTGTLKLADFETTQDWPYWQSTSYNWRPGSQTGGNLHDPDIGGSYVFSPWIAGSTEYQDVPVDSALQASSFPVSVEWLQTGYSNPPSLDTINVWLSFLDRNKNEISKLDNGAFAGTYRYAILDRNIAGTAPAGTAYVRVNMKLDTGRSWVDNVALKINGVDVSEINGGYGMPTRPTKYLRNGDFEAQAQNWLIADPLADATYRDSTGYLEDPKHAQGTHTLGNTWGYGYGNMHVYQQVWLNGNDKQKPFRIDWQQATTTNNTYKDAVTVNFFNKDGTLVYSLSGSQFYDPARFWRNRYLTTTIPANADFYVLDILLPDNKTFVDNVVAQINGATRTLGGASNGTMAAQTCPTYTNTVNGPSDNKWAQRWWFTGTNTGDPAIYSSLSHGLFSTNEYYKTYCVGPNDKWILGDYNLAAQNSRSGLAYTAYDYNGNVITTKTFSYTVSNVNVAEHESEIFFIPAGTNYLTVSTYIDPAGNGNYSTATWNNINLTANGIMPLSPSADTSTILRNGAAELSGQHWTNALNNGGVMSNTPSPEWHSIPQGHFAWDKFPNGNRTTIVCDTVQCGADNGYANQMLFSLNGDGNYFQDVYISGYNFPAGSNIHVQWLQSTASNTVVSASNMDKYSMSVRLEFYDMQDNLIGQTDTAAPAVDGGSNGGVFQDSFDATLPGGTYKLRFYLNNMKQNGAAVDDIIMTVNGTQISRNN
jgi:hypothetical protein